MIDTKSLPLIDLSEIQKLQFPEDQYFRESYPKSQIVLHHTASGRGINGDFRYWLNDPKRIATCIIIDYYGKIYQLFSSMYWGYHLGIKKSVFKKYDLPYVNLNKTTVAVEIDSWGWLTKAEDGRFISYTNKEIPEKEVIEYPDGFRGKKYYQKYSEAQIRTVAQLLIYWNKRYDIPLDYNEDMWDVSVNALKGKRGVYTHASYRSDKFDCHPDKGLIKMLKSLK